MLAYTVTIHSIRKAFGLSPMEYMLCDMVYHLSNNKSSSCTGWCYASRSRLAEELGLTKKAVIDMIERMIVKGLIERHPETKHLRTAHKWDCAFTDNSGVVATPTVRNEAQGIGGSSGTETTPSVTSLHRIGIATTPNIYSYINTSNSQIQNTPFSPLSQRNGQQGTAPIGYQTSWVKEESHTSPKTPTTLPPVSRTTPETTTAMETDLSPKTDLTPPTPGAKGKTAKKEVITSDGGGAVVVKKKRQLTGYQADFVSMINQLRASKKEYGFIDENGFVDQQIFGAREAASAKRLYELIHGRLSAKRAQIADETPVTEMDVLEAFKQLMYACAFVMERTSKGFLKDLFDINYITFRYEMIRREAKGLGFSAEPVKEDPLHPVVERGFKPAHFSERLRSMIESETITREAAAVAFKEYETKYKKLYATF